MYFYIDKEDAFCLHFEESLIIVHGKQIRQHPQ